MSPEPRIDSIQRAGRAILASEILHWKRIFLLCSRLRRSAETSAVRSVDRSEENEMSSETGNAQAREEKRGSGNPNMKRQQEEARGPDHSNARDRENRKGGDNAQGL